MKDYGEGIYLEGHKKIKGRIIVEGSRLYVSGSRREANTFIPLEKLSLIKCTRRGLKIKARLSQTNVINAFIKLPFKPAGRLTGDLVSRYNLKKKFLRREWQGQPAWR
jgi:hypothetical protein